ncbi:MAG TPA: flagellum-specific ATP synthase FliI, partial [Rhodobacterales bacterium]|nr:flagellum-specific ATP synthase FliI [Rhodobacterales bacterium]
MADVGFDQLTAEIAAISPAHDVGRVARIGRGTIEVSGLSAVAAQGDMVEIDTPGHSVRRGEVLNLAQDLVTVLPDGDIEGLSIGAAVTLLGSSQIAPDDSWIGRVIDPMGQPLDGRPILRGATARPLRGVPMNPTERRVLGSRLETGLAVFNTLLPIVRGQRIGLFAGSGVGKSTLLAKFARGVHADVVVIALIGERGREVREFVERVLGVEG